MYSELKSRFLMKVFGLSGVVSIGMDDTCMALKGRLYSVTLVTFEMAELV